MHTGSPGFPKREGHGPIQRLEPAAARKERLRWTDKQEALRRQQTRERFHGQFLRRPVKVNQEISTEDHIIWLLMEAEIWREEVSLAERHQLAEPRCQDIIVSRRLKIALTESQRFASKRVGSIHTAGRTLQRARADIQGIHVKLSWREAAVQQAHDHGIRLLA